MKIASLSLIIASSAFYVFGATLPKDQPQIVKQPQIVQRPQQVPAQNASRDFKPVQKTKPVYKPYHSTLTEWEHIRHLQAQIRLMTARQEALRKASLQRSTTGRNLNMRSQFAQRPRILFRNFHPIEYFNPTLQRPRNTYCQNNQARRFNPHFPPQRVFAFNHQAAPESVEVVNLTQRITNKNGKKFVQTNVRDQMIKTGSDGRKHIVATNIRTKPASVTDQELMHEKRSLMDILKQGHSSFENGSTKQKLRYAYLKLINSSVLVRLGVAISMGILLTGAMFVLARGLLWLFGLDYAVGDEYEPIIEKSSVASV